MSADPELDPPDPAEQRAALRHIIAHRQIRRSIRSSGTGALVWGGVMLALWYVAYYQPGRAGQPLAVIHLCLGLGELTAGLWKKLFPTPEAHLFDGLVLLGFAGANALRVWAAVQAKQGVPPLAAVFGVMMLLSALQHARQYRDIRRARFRRPAAGQLRWFDELVAETRAADPEFDQASLDLPTRPPVRVKLLGDNCLVLSPGDADPAVVARAAVHISRDGPRGRLFVDGEDAGGFELDEHNWRNYAAWKAAGGEPVG